MSNLPKMRGPSLTVDSDVTEDTLTVMFRGTADVEAKPDLERVVRETHEHAKQTKVKKVNVDFRELEFMNSSSFKVFVSWLALVQELPASEQYKITIRSNSSMHWQRRSLAALSCFAVDLVSIET